MTLVVQDSGAFVVRLGNDTLSMEQYTRTATQLRGEYVIRTPRSLHRIYTFDLNPDGTVRRLELVTHNIGGGPGPMETDRKSTRLNSSHSQISYAVFCLKKKKKNNKNDY